MSIRHRKQQYDDIDLLTMRLDMQEKRLELVERMLLQQKPFEQYHAMPNSQHWAHMYSHAQNDHHIDNQAKDKECVKELSENQNNECDIEAIVTKVIQKINSGNNDKNEVVEQQTLVEKPPSMDKHQPDNETSSLRKRTMF